MAIPTSYTIESFTDYLRYEVLLNFGVVLGWSENIPRGTVVHADSPNVNIFESIINDALLDLGKSDISEVTGSIVNRFRGIGRIELWRRVASYTAFDYNTTVDEAGMVRNQIHRHALEQLEMTEEDYESTFPEIGDSVNLPQLPATTTKTKIKVVW